MEIKIGDSVKVKQGIKEPDSEDHEIGGWQGRVIKINNESDAMGNTLITIEWDSLTLEQMTAQFISQSEINGLDWQTMNLFESDLDKTMPRDNHSEVKRVQDLLADKYYWASFGEEGIRISNILAGSNPEDEIECFQKWDNFLENELSFPIQAVVAESEDNWITKEGDKVQIKSLSEIVDLYGIIAKITLRGKSLEVPLCDLEAIDKKSADYQLIKDYRIWFANK